MVLRSLDWVQIQARVSARKGDREKEPAGGGREDTHPKTIQGTASWVSGYMDLFFGHPVVLFVIAL